MGIDITIALGGKQVFAVRVNLPAVAMPERSYLRSSIAEIADAIREEPSAEIVDAMALMTDRLVAAV